MLLCGEQKEWKRKSNEYVYFNSNQYLGNAPSVDSEAMPLPSLSNQLLNQNANKILSGAESRLLKTMVHFASARSAMKAALANRANSPLAMEWSTPDREWLFHTLTESPGHEPLPENLQENGSAVDLFNYLKTRSDAPDGAFAIEEENGLQSQNNTDGNTWFESTCVDEMVNGRKGRSSSRGTLDAFFLDVDDVMKSKLGKYSISHDERAELTVQEAVATMLKASAMRRLYETKNEWKVSSDCLGIRKAEKHDTDKEGEDGVREALPFDNLNTEELEVHCNKLGEEVLDTMSIVRELSESLTKLRKRLLDYCSETEGRISKSKQDELAKMLQEHIESLPDDDDRETPGYEEGYIFGSDEFRSDIDSKYGGLPKKTQEEKYGKDHKDEALFESVFE